MRLTPKEAMLMALAEGRKGAGFVSPNPLVGCVILDREGNLLSRGYHARVGEAHAEVNALAAVKDPAALAGAHVFVTLEPCAHEGRTPSCAKALAKLPIAAVTFGLVDPNPEVSGQGAEILRKAGKIVTKFEGLETQLEELCEIFLTNMRLGRPFVALKVASSLDGKIALSDGSSQWITGESAREHVQFLRGNYDAVLVGAGTFLKDNPRLNSRDPRFKDKRRKVVVLDPDGQCKFEGSNLLSVRPAEDVLVVTNKASKRSAKIPHLILEGADFNLTELLTTLFSMGIYSLFIEGGAGTYASFLRQKLVDRVYLFMAPKILGEGLSWTHELPLTSMNDAVRLENLRVETFGGDHLFTGRPVFGPELTGP